MNCGVHAPFEIEIEGFTAIPRCTLEPGHPGNHRHECGVCEAGKVIEWANENA